MMKSLVILSAVFVVTLASDKTVSFYDNDIKQGSLICSDEGNLCCMILDDESYGLVRFKPNLTNTYQCYNLYREKQYQGNIPQDIDMECHIDFEKDNMREQPDYQIQIAGGEPPQFPNPFGLSYSSLLWHYNSTSDSFKVYPSITQCNLTYLISQLGILNIILNIVG